MGAVSLFGNGNDDEERLRRPLRVGFVTAVPPAAAAIGLATHVSTRVSATLRSISQDVTCLAWDKMPMAQLPAVLMRGPVLGSSTTLPSRMNSYRRVSQPPMPGLPSFASQE